MIAFVCGVGIILSGIISVVELEERMEGQIFLSCGQIEDVSDWNETVCVDLIGFTEIYHILH